MNFWPHGKGKMVVTLEVVVTALTSYFIWSSTDWIQRVEAVEKKTYIHDTDIAVVRSRLQDIKEAISKVEDGVEFLVRERRGNR